MIYATYLIHCFINRNNENSPTAHLTKKIVDTMKKRVR
jgi:hypothetical protein